MKALIKDGIIIQTSNLEFPVHPDFIWMDCPDECDLTWTFENGRLAPPVPIQPNNQEMQAKLLPSEYEMVRALWSAVMNGDKSLALDLDKKIKSVKQQYPIEA